MNGFWPALYVINAVLDWRIASNFTTYSSAIFPLDIDECAANENRCSHKCNNTEGSYTCSCVDGFRLDADNVTCIGSVKAKLRHYHGEKKCNSLSLSQLKRCFRIKCFKQFICKSNFSFDHFMHEDYLK